MTPGEAEKTCLDEKGRNWEERSRKLPHKKIIGACLSTEDKKPGGRGIACMWKNN